MLSRSRYVLIGGAGFVGFQLAKKLANNGAEICIIDDFSNSNLDEELQHLIENRNVVFRNLDASRQDLESHIDSNTIVLNLAAINGTDNFYTKPFTVLQKSTMVGLNAASISAQRNALRYFYFGSSESYASAVNLGLAKTPTSERVPLVIDSPSNPRWSYATSKTLGEVAFFAAKSEYGLKGGVFRLHNAYGPRMGFKHVIPDLMYKFSKGNFEVLNCSHTRSFIYSQDLVNIIIQLIDSDFVYETFPVMNIGSSNEVSIETLATLICEIMGLPKNLSCVSGHEGSVKRRVPDISKLKSYYSGPFTDIAIGLSETYEYYRNQKLI